jgi:dCMP deaminase
MTVDEFMMQKADEIATHSNDPSTRVGAVVTDGVANRIGHACNHFPDGVKESAERLNDRPTKYKMMVHAEVGALLSTPDLDRAYALYCTCHPCANCVAVAIQAGIKRIVCRKPNPRWLDDVEICQTMCREAGVSLEVIE